MIILSVDTSSKICAVAILENNTLIKEESLDNGLTHSETLMPNIKKLLDSLNLKLNDIDLLVGDRGPGSFTGIRIGIATVKAFADSLNIRSIGVSSLEALTYNVDSDKMVCSLIDARRENVYCGIFKNHILQQELFFDNISNVLSKLSAYSEPIIFVGDGSVLYRTQILDVLPNSEFSEFNDLSGYKLGVAGYNKFKNNNFEEILPLYLNRPQAEKMLEMKKKEEQNG